MGFLVGSILNSTIEEYLNSGEGADIREGETGNEHFNNLNVDMPGSDTMCLDFGTEKG